MPYLTLILVLILNLSAFANSGSMITVEDARKLDNQTRAKEEAKLILSAERLAKKSKVPEAIELVKDLKQSLVLFEPTSEGAREYSARPIEKARNKNWIGIAMLLPSDIYVSDDWKKIYSNDIAAAFYYYPQRYLAVKVNQFSEAFQSLIFIHEGYHAYKHVERNFTEFKTNVENCQNEIETYELEIKILEAIGGKQYFDIRKNEENRISEIYRQEKMAGAKLKLEYPDYAKYDPRMDKFLGAPKSVLERHDRMTLIWINANIRLVDLGNRINPAAEKTAFICMAMDGKQ